MVKYWLNCSNVAEAPPRLQGTTAAFPILFFALTQSPDNIHIRRQPIDT